MNQLVNIGAANVPDHIARRMNNRSSVLSNILSSIDNGGASIPKISKRASRFRLIVGGEETIVDSLVLPVIIVDGNPATSKVFYKTSYEGKTEPGPPDCFSYDGVRPESQSKAVQAETCASCPNGVWGSKVSESGKKNKLCSDHKRLAVIFPNDPDATVFLLDVTGSEFVNLKEYLRHLERGGYSTEIVVTNLRFDPSTSHPKLMFEFGGFVKEDALARIDTLFGDRYDEVLNVTCAKPTKIMEAQQAKPVVVNVPKPVEDAVYEEPKSDPPAKQVTTNKFGIETAAPTQAATTKKTHKEPPAAKTSTSDDIAAMLEKIMSKSEDDE